MPIRPNTEQRLQQTECRLGIAILRDDDSTMNANQPIRQQRQKSGILAPT